jgi:glutathione peroxidase
VKFGAKFDMFAKVAVKGDQTAPLFDWLQSAETNPRFAGAIKWNFNKFLVGKDGSVIGRFEPKVEPTLPEVKSAIEAALKS